MVRIEIPDEIALSAEKFLSLSGYASVSDAARSIMRKWVDEQELKSKQEQNKSDVLRENTLKHLLPQWMNNFGENLSTIKKSKDLWELEKVEKISKAKSAIIIGAGPSLKKYNHLKMLKDSGYTGLIIACDKILKTCLEEGVIPDIVVSIDGDKEVMEYYNTPILKNYADKIQVLLSTTVNPAVIDAWPCKDTIHFMNCHMDTMEGLISLSRGMYIMGNKTVIQTGGNVGMTCWFIAHALKKNPLCMTGIEFSCPCPVDVQEIESYQMYYNMHGGNMEKVLKCFRRDYNPFFKNESITHYVWDTYFEVARSWIEALYAQHGILTYNCTGSGLMHSFKGIEQMYFDEFLKTHKE